MPPTFGDRMQIQVAPNMTSSTLSPVQRGIILMIAAIICFTIMDAFGKAVTSNLSVTQTVWARYLGQLIVVLCVLRAKVIPTMVTQFPKLQLLRAVIQIVTFFLFFMSLQRLGLAEATAIFEISPVLITLGAALFLGERFGVQRGIGITLGMIGMLIIVRPGADVFTPYAILPICAAMCFAAYALITRHIGQSESVWTSLIYSGLVGSVVMSALLPFSWVTPTTFDILRLAAIAIVGAAAQFLLVRAFAETEASILAPFAYVSLVFSTLWGVLFFDEYPDIYVMIGAGLIAVSGIYIWYRETRI